VVLRVLVCGGGALGHVFAGVIGALHNAQVLVLTRKPTEWSRTILVHHSDVVVVGHVIATDDPMAANHAELILIAAPAYSHAAILHRLLPYIPPDSWIGALPAIGGFDLLVRNLMTSDMKVLGSVRAPYNARVTRYGNEVVVTGVTPRLDLVVGRGARQREAVALVEWALGLRSRTVQPFLLATLSPAGTIFHTARLFELLTEPVAPELDFYAAWGVEASRAYLAMDAELTALRRFLGCDVPGMDAASHYGVSDPEGLAARIRSLKGLPKIDAPVRNGTLDLNDRFVQEDVPYGLCLVRNIASKLGLPCPAIATVLEAILGAAGTAASSLTKLPPHLALLDSARWTAEALEFGN
jgi:opine dehydrogenase